MSCLFSSAILRTPWSHLRSFLKALQLRTAAGLLPNTVNIPLWPKIHNQNSKYWPLLLLLVSALQLLWWQLRMSWHHTQPLYEGRIKYEAGSENIKRKHERMLCKARFFENMLKDWGWNKKSFQLLTVRLLWFALWWGLSRDWPKLGNFHPITYTALS